MGSSSSSIFFNERLRFPPVDEPFSTLDLENAIAFFTIPFCRNIADEGLSLYLFFIFYLAFYLSCQMAGMTLLYTDTTHTSYIHYVYSIHHTLHTHTHTHYKHYTHSHYIHYTTYILSFMSVNTLLLLITLFLKVLNPSCCNVLKIKTAMGKTIKVKVFSSWQKPISPHGWWQLEGYMPFL